MKKYCNDCKHSGIEHYCQPYNEFTDSDEIYDKNDRNANGNCKHYEKK